MKKRLLTTAFLLTIISMTSLLGASSPQKADIPKVLIIGDSISIGYTPYVTKMIEGKAHIARIKGNGEHTSTGLKKLDSWIGKTQWDLIHFNWGLWDLCYRHPKSKVQGKRDKVNGTVTTSLNQYEKNLEELVQRLKQTGAQLIWANTTFVPEGEAGRILGDDDKYNQAAARVMKKHDVTINDLNTLTASFPANYFSKPGDVHYTGEGYSKIAEQVADAILTKLENE